MSKTALLSVFLCFTSLFGCSESITLYKSTRGGVELADVGQCQTGPYQGAYSYNPTGLSFAAENTNYFAKMMVFDHIRALYETSGWASALYIRNLGVPVEKVQENPKANCRYFAFLPPPSNKNRENWIEVSASDTSGGKLLGLFTSIIERNTNTGQSRLIDQQIMIREDANRWTLLHELGHYLFALENVKQPNLKFNRELQEELRVLTKEIEELREKITNNEDKEENSLLLVKKWNAFFQIGHKIHIRGALEEFSLESLLLEEYTKGRLQLIDEFIEPLNAIAYMEISARDVLSRYKRFIRRISNFKDTHFEDQ